MNYLNQLLRQLIAQATSKLPGPYVVFFFFAQHSPNRHIIVSLTTTQNHKAWLVLEPFLKFVL